MGEKWNNMGSGQKAACVLAALIVLAIGDWMFSVGPMTQMAVGRCIDATEGTSESFPPDPNDTFTRTEASDFCWSLKRNGALTLSGGINSD